MATLEKRAYFTLSCKFLNL